MNEKFEVCLIAAGEGSRLREEGIKTSKPLIEVNGIPLIDRLFRIISKYNPTNVHCIINEDSPDLKSHLDKYDFNFPFNLKIKSTESSFHSFYEVSKFVESENFLLTTTDSIFDPTEFDNFVTTYFNQKDKIDGLMSVTEYIDDEKPLCVELNNEDKITKFSDSPEGCELATGGIYFFNKIVLNEMNSALENNVSRLRNYLRLLIEKKYHLSAYRFDKIIDVDHVEDLKKAEKFLNEI